MLSHFGKFSIQSMRLKFWISVTESYNLLIPNDVDGWWDLEFGVLQLPKLHAHGSLPSADSNIPVDFMT